MARSNTTTKELIAKLQEKLVQDCIDFIRENELGDLDTVNFSADMLQESSNFGYWTPATDSTIAGWKQAENGGLVPFVDYS